MPAKVVFGNTKPVLWFVSRVDSKSRFAIFLSRILWKMRVASCENISVGLTSLARREKCDILCNLRDLQRSKIIIHSEKLVLDPKFSQDFRVKIRKVVCETCESCYKICLRDLQEASLATKFLSVRLVRSNSRYEISVCETRKKRVSLLILTCKSYENFGSKKSCFWREFQKNDSCVNPNCEESRKSKPNHHVNARCRVDTKWRFQFFMNYDYRFLLDVIIMIIATFFTFIAIYFASAIITIISYIK
jgi:hypothetical protein